MAHPFPPDLLVAAFSRLVARRAADTIVMSSERRATLGDIDSMARALDRQFAASSIEAGGLVGLAAPNGPGFLAGFLALRRAGHAALLLDPLAPLEERQRVVGELGASVVLECTETWPSSVADFRVSKVRATVGQPALGDAAVVKLTSGSTGLPRGVAISTESLLADEAALAHTMGLREGDRLLTAIPLSHSYGFTTLALSALVRGLVLVLPPDRGPFAPLLAARELGATVFPTVPAYVQGLLKMSTPPPLPGVVRLVISAGAVLPTAVAAQFRETYGQPLHAFYGSSECGGIAYDREGDAAERGTVGTPVEGVRISLAPLEQNDLDEGLVVVESAGVGETYLPEPDRRLGGGRFETSDIGAWSGGELVLRRRVDRVINVRGRKVDPSEVESVLVSLCGVEDVVVVGVSSPGQGEIVRAVIACPSGRLGHDDVVSWCRTKLADHKVPRSVVILDAIPRTSRGKVDRSALVSPEDIGKQTGLADGA